MSLMTVWSLFNVKTRYKLLATRMGRGTPETPSTHTNQVFSAPDVGEAAVPPVAAPKKEKAGADVARCQGFGHDHLRTRALIAAILTLKFGEFWPIL